MPLRIVKKRETYHVKKTENFTSWIKYRVKLTAFVVKKHLLSSSPFLLKIKLIYNKY